MRKTTLFTVYCLLFTVCSIYAQIPIDSLKGIYKGTYYSRIDTSVTWLIIRPDSEKITGIDTSICRTYLNGCFIFGGGYTTFFTDYTYCYGNPSPQSGFPKFYATDSIQMIANNIPLPPPSTYTRTTRFYGKKIPGSIWVGIKSNDDNNRINIFPNPFVDKIYYDFPQESIFEIRLFSIMGQEMHIEKTKDAKSLNLGFLEKGIYIMEINTNNYIIYKKLIKQ